MPTSLALNLPPLSSRPANPPETRPARIVEWLGETLRREPVEASRIVGDALAATNRVAMGDARRLELAEIYWDTAVTLWPQLERVYARATHPLTGDALEAAKAGLTLAHELSTAYKHLLAREAEKRISLGGQRLMVALVHRCLQCTARILVNSYLELRSGARANVARRAPRLRVRALAQGAPDAGRARPARRHARALVRAGVAACAREPVRLPSGPARPGAALPAGARALGEADRRARRCIGWPRPSRSFRSATTFPRSPRTRAGRWTARSSFC